MKIPLNREGLQNSHAERGGRDGMGRGREWRGEGGDRQRREETGDKILERRGERKRRREERRKEGGSSETGEKGGNVGTESVLGGIRNQKRNSWGRGRNERAERVGERNKGDHEDSGCKDQWIPS
jgi:hypothetical protein